MNELMATAGDEGLIDDELKSIRSKLTNTTKMISSKYRKRTRGNKTQAENNDGGRGQKFSVLFVGQWEK